MKKRLIVSVILTMCVTAIHAVDLTRATIVYNPKDPALAGHIAGILADDIGRVSGVRPQVGTGKSKGQNVILATTKNTSRHKELRGKWEQYAIDTEGDNIYIIGSDARGLAYGVFHISEQIGVNPWYWFADVPVNKNTDKVRDFNENYVSESPTIKYRGVFLNDEDWGLKTWAEHTYEKELGDIGPKTYDRICELILRLKGNMLAPAMHSCTGAFYSHPESQVVADK